MEPKTISSIVALPEMMRTAQPGGEQAPLETLPVITITGPEFDPTKYLDADQVEQIREFVVKQLRADTFDHEALMAIIQGFGANDITEMDAMLQGLRMLDFGGMAKTLQNTTSRMRQVTKKIPVISSDWLLKVEAGKLWFRNIADTVRWISGEIEEAIDLWQSFQHEFEEADQELNNHQEQMRENRLRNDAIAKQEFIRSMRLMQLCATLVILQKEIGVRLTDVNAELAKGPNESLTNEKRRLENLVPIMVNTLGSLIPLIPTTSNNGVMFTQQRNDNALQEFRLSLFRQFGIAQWKANTLIQLNAASSRAANLTLSIAKKAMNEEGRKASQAYKDEMAEVARDFQEFMIEMDVFQAQVSAVEEGSKILTEGLKAADKKAHDVFKTIEAGRGKVEDAQSNWSQALLNIINGSPA